MKESFSLEMIQLARDIKLKEARLKKKIIIKDIIIKRLIIKLQKLREEEKMFDEESVPEGYMCACGGSILLYDDMWCCDKCGFKAPNNSNANNSNADNSNDKEKVIE